MQEARELTMDVADDAEGHRSIGAAAEGGDDAAAPDGAATHMCRQGNCGFTEWLEPGNVDPMATAGLKLELDNSAAKN